MDKKTLTIGRYDKIIEASTWLIMIIVIFGVRFLPIKLVDTDEVYLLIGAIIAVALLYYLIIYKYFSRTNRLYIKSIADIVLIGVLIHIVKDYGQFFYALYFLPIAATALSLEFINALLIATIASLFVVFEIFLGAQEFLPTSSELFQGIWQISLILFITVFCRFLAIQLKEERLLKEESLARQKFLEEESRKEKEFLSLTSHQLYTPLSIIRGFTSMLTNGSLGELTPKQKEAVSEIYTGTTRMVGLVSELLSISRIRSGTFEIHPQKLDVVQLVKEIINQFEKTRDHQKGIKIETVLPDNLSPLQADSEKIRQVIYNLVNNALKYTKNGKVTIGVEQDAKETKIYVQDEGVGIPKENFEKLFQPFFRGPNILELDNKGTGLGLYIARLLVEKHEGQIWAESEGVNKGSRFVFVLPNK